MNIHVEFLDECMDRLESAHTEIDTLSAETAAVGQVPQPAGAEDSKSAEDAVDSCQHKLDLALNRISRLIEILKTFIRTCDDNGLRRRRKLAIAQFQPKTLVIRAQYSGSTRNTSFELKMVSTQTVGMLRKTLMNKINPQNQRAIEIALERRKLTEDHKTLAECNFRPRSEVHVSTEPWNTSNNKYGGSWRETEAEQMPEDKEAALPSVLLAAPERIERLFGLCALKLSEATEKSVMDLLQYLPLESKVEQVIHSIWNLNIQDAAEISRVSSLLQELLPCNCSIRTYYCLQALAGACCSIAWECYSKETKGEKQEYAVPRSWLFRSRFVTVGGDKIIQKIFVDGLNPKNLRQPANNSVLTLCTMTIMAIVESLIAPSNTEVPGQMQQGQHQPAPRNYDVERAMQTMASSMKFWQSVAYRVAWAAATGRAKLLATISQLEALDALGQTENGSDINAMDQDTAVTALNVFKYCQNWNDLPVDGFRAF